jgi:anti-anti-sigma regulatory factor
MLQVRAVDTGLTMTGALDHDGGRELLRAIAALAGDIRVDASQVQRIDGAGLTALAVARNRCRADGRAFVLTAVAPEAVQGLRIGDHLGALFAAPAPAITDSGPASSSRATTTAHRRRLSIHLHRHQEM